MIADSGDKDRDNRIGTTNRRATYVWVVLGVGFISLAWRLVLLAVYPFDGLYGQDAYFYLDATRRLEAAWSDPARFWNWLTAAGTPPTSEWPLGYHLQMALASLLTGPGPASGQVVSLVAGTLTPALTAILFLLLVSSSETAGTAPTPFPNICGALIAGLAVGLSPLSVRASLVVMSDMAACMWATAGMVLVVVYSEGGAARTGRGLAAGLCTGIASITRYVYPLLLVPEMLHIAVTKWQAGKRTWEWLVKACRASAPVVVPVVVLSGLQLVYDQLHPPGSGPSPVIGNWSPGHAFQNVFEGPDGHLVYREPPVVYFLLRPFASTSMLGPLPGLLVVAGLFSILRRRATRTWPATVGWWLPFALFYSGNIYQADRFVLSYLPPLGVLAGLGASALIGWAARSRAVTPAWAPGLAVLGLAGLLGLAPLAQASFRDFDALYRVKQDYLAATRCLEPFENGDGGPPPPVLSFAVTFTIREYTGIEPNDLYYQTPDSLRSLLSGSRGDTEGYLVLPLAGFEQQWGNEALGATYHELQRAYTLEPLNCPGTTFSLFRIRRGTSGDIKRGAAGG